MIENLIIYTDRIKEMGMPCKSRKVKGWQLCLTIFMAAILNGCAYLNGIIEKPTASFDQLRLIDASMLQSTLEFRFSVHNPNRINLHAGQISYVLKLNGKHFANGQLDRGLMLPAGSSANINVPVIIRYLDFYESMAEMVRAKQFAYDLRGTIKIGPLQIPIQARATLKTPQLPAISVEAIRVRKLSLTGASLNCQLKINNPNDFNLAFKNFSYNLQLDQTQVAQVNARNPGPVPQNAMITLDFITDLSFARLGLSVFNLLKGNQSTYRIDGRMLFDSPSGDTEAVPFSSFGQVLFTH